ncbi:MAG: hypothetical protein WBV61_01590 [Rhodanobacteraceae bacterium]
MPGAGKTNKDTFLHPGSCRSRLTSDKISASQACVYRSLNEQFGQFGQFGKQTYDFGLTTPSNQVFDAVALQGSQNIAAGFSSVPAPQHST